MIEIDPWNKPSDIELVHFIPAHRCFAKDLAIPGRGDGAFLLDIQKKEV